MVSLKEITNKVIKKNSTLYKTFLPDYKYDFDPKKISKFRKFKTVILIGMGGSTLGAEAIYQFLNHKIKKKFIFINNLEINQKIEKEKLTNLIISKSGNTLETISNTNILLTHSLGVPQSE